MYKLIYFQGCPNAAIAKQVLDEMGVEYDSVCQDNLPEGDKDFKWSSPTVLFNEQIIVGGKTGGEMACTANLTVDVLVAAIKKYAEGKFKLKLS